MQKPYAPKCGQGKTKTNFIPVKVSTLYVKKIQKVFQIVFPLKPKVKTLISYFFLLTDYYLLFLHLNNNLYHRIIKQYFI
jgi:hypothetical protein